MSANVDALRAALAKENENLAADLQGRDAAQMDLAACTQRLGVKDLAVGARRREIDYLEGEIGRIEAENAPDPTDPAGIPLIPLEPATPVEPEPEPVVCGECGRERAPDDRDYDPMQVLEGTPLGWYSGDDGQMCGPCMTNTINGEPNE